MVVQYFLTIDEIIASFLVSPYNMYMNTVMKSYLLKVYHNYNKGKTTIAQFFHDISKTMEGQKIII